MFARVLSLTLFEYKKSSISGYPLHHSTGSLDVAPGAKAGETPDHIKTNSNICHTFKSVGQYNEKRSILRFYAWEKLSYNDYKSADGDAIL